MKPITVTISSGRSGTMLLSKLFEQVPDMFAEHEYPGLPFWSRRIPNLTNPSIGRDFVKKHLEYINNLPGKYFASTDHAYSKGFLEYFLELGIKPTVVILRRNPRDVAKSLFTLNCIPGKSLMPTPDEPGTLPFPNWKNAHSYKLCYWYACDCERRALYYSKYLRDLELKVWETTITKILDINHFNDMLTYFSLPNVTSLPQGKFNQIPELKDVEPPPDDFLEKLEGEVLEMLPPDFLTHIENTNWRTI